MAHYDLVVVARVPQLEGAPQLIELDRIIHNGLSYEYGFIDGNIQAGCNPSLLSESVKQRLRELDKFPCELWLYKKGNLVAQGPITSLTFQGQNLSIYAHGLRYYLRYMYVLSDQNFSTIEQFLIVRDLVNQWQNQAYGDFGLDTSYLTSNSSGITRTREYLREDQHNVHTRIQDLSEVINGFDWWVDNATREVKAAYPLKGEDKSNSIFLDRRNITSDNTNVSVQKDDVASVGLGVSSFSDEENERQTITTERYNTELQESFGLAGIAQSWQDIKNISTLDGHVDKLIADRDKHLLSLGPSLIPVAGVTEQEFTFGDTITYSYDYGLGLVETTRRVLSIQVNVDSNDNETLSVRLS